MKIQKISQDILLASLEQNSENLLTWDPHSGNGSNQLELQIVLVHYFTIVLMIPYSFIASPLFYMTVLASVLRLPLNPRKPEIYLLVQESEGEEEWHTFYLHSYIWIQTICATWYQEHKRPATFQSLVASISHPFLQKLTLSKLWSFCLLSPWLSTTYPQLLSNDSQVLLVLIQAWFSRSNPLSLILNRIWYLFSGSEYSEKQADTLIFCLSRFFQEGRS